MSTNGRRHHHFLAQQDVFRVCAYETLNERSLQVVSWIFKRVCENRGAEKGESPSVSVNGVSPLRFALLPVHTA